MFKLEIEPDDYLLRIKYILGIPSISDFLIKEEVVAAEIFGEAQIFINKFTKKYPDVDWEADKERLESVLIVYSGYLLCPSMQVRIPEKMKDIDTETILKIDWNTLEDKLLIRANKMLDDLLEDLGIEIPTYGLTLMELTDEAAYPNPNA